MKTEGKGKKKTVWYFVSFAGYSNKDDEWVKERDMKGCENKIIGFKRRMEKEREEKKQEKKQQQQPQPQPEQQQQKRQREDNEQSTEADGNKKQKKQGKGSVTEAEQLEKELQDSEQEQDNVQEEDKQQDGDNNSNETQEDEQGGEEEEEEEEEEVNFEKWTVKQLQDYLSQHKVAFGTKDRKQELVLKVKEKQVEEWSPEKLQQVLKRNGKKACPRSKAIAFVKDLIRQGKL